MIKLSILRRSRGVGGGAEVKMEAEIRVMRPQVQERWEPPGEEEARKGLSPRVPRRK